MLYRHQRDVPLIRIQDLVTIHYLTLEADYRFAGERHPFWELVYVDDGAIHAQNGDTDFTATAGELLLHAPDVFHLAEGSGQTDSHVFIISFTSRSPAMAQFRDLQIQLPARLRALISSIMQEASATYALDRAGVSPLPDAPKGGGQLVRLYLEELLILLYRQLTDKPILAPVQDIPAEIILYLNQQLYATLSLEQLCARFHYGKTSLSTLFQSATGRSIMAYYRHLKIQEAKRLLRETTATVAEIAALLHYDTPQYFSCAFKRDAGCSPSQYRRRVRP